jgi:hypothetical protein
MDACFVDILVAKALIFCRFFVARAFIFIHNIGEGALILATSM